MTSNDHVLARVLENIMTDVRNTEPASEVLPEAVAMLAEVSNIVVECVGPHDDAVAAIDRAILAVSHAAINAAAQGSVTHQKRVTELMAGYEEESLARLSRRRQAMIGGARLGVCSEAGT